MFHLPFCRIFTTSTESFNYSVQVNIIQKLPINKVKSHIDLFIYSKSLSFDVVIAGV